MAIRCASKAIIVEKECVLLNRCRHEDGSIYYDLPGGGQHTYENMEEALIREVKEETGYDIKVDRFVALAEEIYTDEALCEKYPEHTHRILHIFAANLISAKRDVPSETDFGMEESVWIPLEEIENISMTRPAVLKKVLYRLIETDAPIYLGTEYMEWN